MGGKEVLAKLAGELGARSNKDMKTPILAAGASRVSYSYFPPLCPQGCLFFYVTSLGPSLVLKIPTTLWETTYSN